MAKDENIKKDIKKDIRIKGLKPEDSNDKKKYEVVIKPQNIDMKVDEIKDVSCKVKKDDKEEDKNIKMKLIKKPLTYKLEFSEVDGTKIKTKARKLKYRWTFAAMWVVIVLALGALIWWFVSRQKKKSSEEEEEL